MAIDDFISTEEETSIILLNFFILLIGGFLCLLGMLLWSRKIPPNRCLGIRIKTMGSSKDLWYEVNEYCGKIITLEGLFLTIFSLLYMALPYSFTFLARILIFIALFIISLGFTVYLCINRAKLFADPSLVSNPFSTAFDNL